MSQTLHQTTTVDAVTAEIIRGNLISITAEMKTNLMRTAYNQIIYEAQDFTVGLFDAVGDTVSIGLGLPMFVGGLSQAVKAKIEHYGIENIHPGDVLLTNDPYIMGSHLNHMIFTLPIFAEDRIVAFASSMAHWLDVGGYMGGTTEDIYAEGLQMPIVKIFKRGVQDDELTRVIGSNVRFREAALGDFRAQVAAIRTGETRLGDLLERYGSDIVVGCFASLADSSEQRARRAVAAIPDGEYFASTSMDDDGVNIGVGVPINVRVVVSGDQMTIDLSEVSPQVAGYFNSGETAGRSAAQVAFKCLTSPHDFPVNEGAFRAVEVVLPPGTVVSAQRPAAMRWWMTYPMTIVDSVFRALSGVLEGGTIAGHHADLAISNLYGMDPATGRWDLFYNGIQGGGWGARRDKDGENATICVNDGDTHNAPVESQEAKHHWMTCSEYSLRQDSGGPGRHRGGLGTLQRWTTRNAVRMDSFIERTQQAPWGVDGGGDALPNRVSVIDESGTEHTFANGKVDGRKLAPGEAVVVGTGGGGGYGNPHERPVEDVLADVVAGYVSPEKAESAYGIRVTHDPITGTASAGSDRVRGVASASSDHNITRP